ncbi:hypothetical protein KPH14_002365 [Odynerus spinipes]|uniref:Uncharacterized protein n=1 Tax=Odynerus spinipes TaxID=1348599 RepID=A0AAD9RLE1_9HYME|nr:hypothetical protein KPH14_002365 [Odynerus spinipes]
MAEKIVKKKKKKSSKRKKAVAKVESKIKAEEDRVARQKAAEEERLRNWEEAWEKKLQAQEELDNLKCCMSKGLCLRPKTQSNIWIKVLQDKTRNMQEVQMAIKRVPVPKPKPPPLPKCTKTDLTATDSKTEKCPGSPKKRKKIAKRKGKKKKT